MRLFAKDVRDIILDYLKNNLNNKIEELKNKYTNLLDIHKIQTFNNVIDFALLPCLVVTVSEGRQIEDNADIEINAEVYSVQVEVLIKEADFKTMQDVLDCYEEAIKTLLNYKIEEFTYIRYINHKKGFITEERKGTVWSGIFFEFEVRIN